MTPTGSSRLLHPPGSRVGSTPDGFFWFAVAVVAACALGLVAVGVQDPLLGLGVLLGWPVSWLLRRGYQRLPTGQQLVTVLDPDGRVRVVAGRGAVAPLVRRLRSDRPAGADAVLGVAVGAVIGLVMPALVALAAVTLDQPVVAIAPAAAVVWLLVELVVRIAVINRRLARGARLGRDETGALVAVWQATHDTSWRPGVLVDDLVAAGREHPVLRDRALAVVRPLLEVRPPR